MGILGGWLGPHMAIDPKQPFPFGHLASSQSWASEKWDQGFLYQPTAPNMLFPFYKPWPREGGVWDILCLRPKPYPPLRSFPLWMARIDGGLQLDLVHIIPLGTEDISLSLQPQQEASGVVFLLLLWITSFCLHRRTARASCCLLSWERISQSLPQADKLTHYTSFKSDGSGNSRPEIVLNFILFIYLNNLQKTHIRQKQK